MHHCWQPSLPTGPHFLPSQLWLHAPPVDSLPWPVLALPLLLENKMGAKTLAQHSTVYSASSKKNTIAVSFRSLSSAKPFQVANPLTFLSYLTANYSIPAPLSPHSLAPTHPHFHRQCLPISLGRQEKMSTWSHYPNSALPLLKSLRTLHSAHPLWPSQKPGPSKHPLPLHQVLINMTKML